MLYCLMLHCSANPIELLQPNPSTWSDLLEEHVDKEKCYLADGELPDETIQEVFDALHEEFGDLAVPKLSGHVLSLGKKVTGINVPAAYYAPPSNEPDRVNRIHIVPMHTELMEA
jgi:hypothetical protein